MDLAQLSGRGTLTLPAAVRRRLGLVEGDVLTIRVEGGSIVLTPSIVTPVEVYTDDRIAEFEHAGQLTADEVELARSRWARAPRRK